MATIAARFDKITDSTGYYRYEPFDKYGLIGGTVYINKNGLADAPDILYVQVHSVDENNRPENCAAFFSKTAVTKRYFRYDLKGRNPKDRHGPPVAVGFFLYVKKDAGVETAEIGISFAREIAAKPAESPVEKVEVA